MIALQITGMMMLTILGGILYRMGGSGRYDTKARDVGVSLCMLAAMLLLWTEWAIDNHKVPGFLISLVLCFGLHFGAMTTYWKRGVDARLWNWMFTGLGYSLSMFPFAILTGCWLGFWLRTIVLTAGTAIWSESVGNDIWEERGRGAMDIATLPILLI